MHLSYSILKEYAEKLKEKIGETKARVLPRPCHYSRKIPSIVTPSVTIAAQFSSCPKFLIPIFCVPQTF